MSAAESPGRDADEAPQTAPTAPPRPRRLLLHAGLFLATFLTTTAAGAMLMHARAGVEGWEAILPISDGLSYSLPLMLILLSHELGHYIVARLHGVDASLPYFIPLPPSFGLGTMGAVIGMRDVTSDRKKLIDIGAAGPLAGLLVAVPVILYGLHRSPVGPLVPGGEQEGNSLLYALLKHAATGAWLPDGKRDVFLHPTAWAGWVGLLVTMINLIPIGQLDGGHIATAYFGNRYGRFATAAAPDPALRRAGRLLVGHARDPDRGRGPLERVDGTDHRAGRGAPLAGLVHDDPDPAGGLGGREPSARRRQAAAAQSQAALLADGGGVRRGADAGPVSRQLRGRRRPAARAGRDHRALVVGVVDARSQPMKVPPFELPLDEIRASLEKLRRPLSVAVLRARNPFNVGAIIRVAHSFLVREILLVGDERFYERGAMGMDRYENIVLVPTEAEFIARVRAAGRPLLVFEKDAARVDLWHAELPDDCVMLFGSETAGVSPELLAAADQIIGIPMYGINHSFPVTVAAGIAMAEWTRRHYVT